MTTPYRHPDQATAVPLDLVGGGDRPRIDITFWACVFATLIFSQFYLLLLTGPGTGGASPQSSAANSQSAFLRLIFLPVYLIVLLVICARPLRFLAVLTRSWLLLGLLSIAVCSVLWSLQPDVTIRRLVAVVFTTLTGVLLAERFEWPKTLEVLASTYAVVVTLSFVFGLFMPAYGVMSIDFPGAWRGVYGFKNQLGWAMSLATPTFLACALANPQRRRLWLGFAGAALLLIVLSTSKTALVSCLAGLAFMPLIALCRIGPALGTTALLAAVSVVALVGAVYALAPELVFELIGRDATFTGRTLIWDAISRQIEQRPLTGYGYGAVWDDLSGWGPVAWISNDQGFKIFSAHNTVLGVWLELGLIGVTAWLMLLVGAWLKGLSRLATAPAYFFLPFLAIFTLHSLTESDALIQNDLGWVIFSMTVTKLAMPFRPGGGERAQS
ncbi:O-antigen ligase family protein [Caulobacter vibrioides]|uniref:HfsI n=2 Tax=Caulobacter vibrioides TaxID=155892 RepID=Q9AAU5_CAUVC|nr:polysaccharide biosynthesis protein HfsI [Caulobacter vibrioides]YP_002515906.1 secreted polysaccharide polymerase hfsI [Caulobacter vibrioides NA1000]AAK22486.1 HfsI [Caulobacter vibrioides CB15]ACL93998.1 secreted polysaccharide polymerase hfsI [Caulobacter vibrioides NA1000]ATC23511.1 O-antigen ligase family protein [Caulobacter vibrioides]ATC27349.1 O-antigen ligase family protein [Caulobacter vibrioides]AZH11729.1 O-antigen ligase family protein [Caulobacter vibrioides]